MRHANRQRRTYIPSLDGLETRKLMASGFRSAFLTQNIMSAIASRIPPIQGTIHGTVTHVIPLSAQSEQVIYTAVAKANIIGDGRGFGSHVIISRPFRGGMTVDQYRNGSASVTGTTDTVSIFYSGNGLTHPDGSFTANWKGRAQSVAGEHSGLAGSFSAHATGNARTGDFSINITIRV